MAFRSISSPERTGRSAERPDGSKFELVLDKTSRFQWRFTHDAKTAHFDGSWSADGNLLVLEGAQGGSLIGEAARTRSAAAGSAELRRKVVTSAACQAAIKVNYPLTREGMQVLLDGLFATENPTTCPHGRPILFRLTLEEIERAFRRR